MMLVNVIHSHPLRYQLEFATNLLEILHNVLTLDSVLGSVTITNKSATSVEVLKGNEVLLDDMAGYFTDPRFNGASTGEPELTWLNPKKMIVRIIWSLLKTAIPSAVLG